MRKQSIESKSREPTGRQRVIRCTGCGAWGLERERFCSCCGRPIPERTCAGCGSPTGHLGALYCPNCGKELKAEG